MSVLLLLLLTLQNPAPAKPAPPAPAKAAAAVKPPPGPKTAPELTVDLDTALKADPLADDTIAAAVEGDTITLTGTIRTAEHKGVATRIARSVAEHDGWNSEHVINHLAVAPAHPN